MCKKTDTILSLSMIFENHLRLRYCLNVRKLKNENVYTATSRKYI